MSNSKRLPRGRPVGHVYPARPRAAQASVAHGRLGSQTGATILAAGLAGAVLAIPATAYAATGSDGSAGAGNTNAGAVVPAPAPGTSVVTTARPLIRRGRR